MPAVCSGYLVLKDIGSSCLRILKCCFTTSEGNLAVLEKGMIKKSTSLGVKYSLHWVPLSALFQARMVHSESQALYFLK